MREYGADIASDPQARADFQALKTSFEDYYLFLRQVVKQLAAKGQFKELHTRLDYNNFAK